MTQPSLRREFLKNLETYRNVPVEANGLGGHMIDTNSMLRLLMANRHEPYFLYGLVRATTLAPRFVLEHTELYADKPFAQAIIAMATKKAIKRITTLGILPSGGLPLELPAALEALHENGALHQNTMSKNLARALMDYRKRFRTIYTEPTDYTEPTAPRQDMERTSRFFEWAEKITSPTTSVLAIYSLDSALLPARAR